MTRRMYTVDELRGPRVKAPTGPDADDAKRMRRTFTDSELSFGAYALAGAWPARFRHIGRNHGVAYSSDKWMKDGTFNDYKHLSEARQELFAAESTQPQSGSFQGRVVDLHRVLQLPSAIAELAPLLFLDVQLFDGPGRLADAPSQILPARALVYGGRATMLHGGKAGSKRPFLVVASKENGIMFLVIGDKLDVKKDGIEG